MSDARGRGVARQLHSGGQAGGQPGGQARSSGRKAKPRAAGWRQRFGFIIAFVLATMRCWGRSRPWCWPRLLAGLRWGG